MIELFSVLLPTVNKLFDALFPNKNESDKIKLEFLRLQTEGQLKALEHEANLRLQQMAINTEEAKSNSLFVAGWRPAVGWICVLAFGYCFVLNPFLQTILGIWGIVVPSVMLNIPELMTILMGMLGLGAYRSFDKAKEVDKEKFYAELRSQLGRGVTTQEVAMLDRALDKADD